MPDHTTHLSTVRLGLIACCLFITLGACIIPYTGIQSDEALFTAPIYQYGDNNLHVSPFPRHPPLMVIGYIGSLKTFLYWPILGIFRPSVWTLRLPAVLIGALSIFIFFNLALSAGRTVAVLGGLLLATDPVFILTDTFDWGPVALEHLMLVTGCWFLFHFGSQPSSGRTLRYLGLGFFCFGLALWNKAVFVWALTGLTAGTLLVFWPEFRERLTRRNLAVAASAFLLGASPLVAYNVRHFSATLSGNVQVEPSRLPTKWIQLERALNGSSLFGYMVSEESSPTRNPTGSLAGRVAVWLREHLGPHRETGFYYVFGALLLAAPWWWRSRAARFSLVFSAAAWIAMASLHNAGGAAHHVILLWPFPILFAAVALDSLPWRPVAILAGVAMVAMNLLVVNQYISQFERNGPAGSFTDAIFPLSASLPEKPDATLYVLDWGISESVAYLHQGRLILPAKTDPDANEIHRMVSDPQSEFINHVPGQEFFPQLGQELDADARASGYHKEVLRTVPDSEGRPVFEVFRLIRN